MISDFLEQEERKDMLRLLTAGSVDDGKSTLIGRLLVECKQIYEDQLQAISTAPSSSNSGQIDYSLLCDGLKAEREQGITIDVAYRYFATAKRKFIIADTPGHEQYTRNMVTGGSTADIAVILVDIAHGITTQTRRHSHIIDMLGIRHVVFAVNKMDIVDYSHERFEALANQLRGWVTEQNFSFSSMHIIPISALCGDNIVSHSENMRWYKNHTLLEILESTPLSTFTPQEPFRMMVQYVIHPNQNFRGYAGRIASGTIRVGDEITVLPSGKSCQVAQILTAGTLCSYAFAPQSIAIVLDNQIDISRGDMVVRSDQKQPEIGHKITAIMVWMDEQAMDSQKLYYLKQATHTVRAKVTSVEYAIDVNSGKKRCCNTLQLNQIASVEILCSAPIVCDSYSENRTTGAFIVIDPMTNFTAAAGIITGVREYGVVADSAETINISLSEHGIKGQQIALLQRFCRIIESRCGVVINCTE